MMDKKTEDFYIRLKEELSNSTLWPSEYLYKFILPSSNIGIAKIEAEFNDKVINCVKYAKNLEADINAIKDAIDSMTKRKKSLENKLTSIKLSKI